MIISQDRTQNLLLASLPTDDFNRLSPYMELVLMPFGEYCYENKEDRAESCC